MRVCLSVSVCVQSNFNFMHFLLGKCGLERVEVGEKRRLDDRIGIMRFIVNFLPNV